MFVMGGMYACGAVTCVAVLGVGGYEDGVVTVPLARGDAVGSVDM